MVEIKLHDGLGDFVGKTWKLNVKKVSEALHAINCLSNGKLYNYLHKHGADSFQVVVNGRVLEGQETFDPQDPEIIQKIKNSIYNIKLGQLKTIDIVPVYKLADQNTLGIVLGVVLIIVGILVAVGTLGGGAPLAAALIIGGIGIIAAGVINLLSKPPIFEDFREIQQGGKSSYLFNGPENTVKEGGPVPIGFGTLTVGSQVVSANYEIEYYATNFESTPVSNGLIRAYNFGGLDISYYKSISTAYPNPFFEQEAAPGTEVVLAVIL
jgi:predicted phage tail protein